MKTQINEIKPGLQTSMEERAAIAEKVQEENPGEIRLELANIEKGTTHRITLKLHDFGDGVWLYSGPVPRDVFEILTKTSLPGSSNHSAVLTQAMALGFCCEDPDTCRVIPNKNITIL